MIKILWSEHSNESSTFESVGEILSYDHSNESYLAVLSVILFIVLYKVVLTFESVDEIL